MKKKLGIYEYYIYKFEVFVDTDMLGATHNPNPEKPEALPQIVIGLAHEKYNWDKVVGNIIHEIEEALLLIMGFRYENCRSDGWNADRYVFHFTHPEFSDIISITGGLLEKMYEDVKKAFFELKKKK